ncbi:AMP-binding protein [Xinfangfangia sp. D13-10-4-6]|uniref:AMP-binding protein n=1 Tax=Pseudogemmobacter hezensis TaxID=2737662 RepID=UPI0015521491|nr:AMP-binding protein [Pseudogemmobacter hezensis]NPD14826.1 AMP-binding protein [Pseudogemmobacter hezensis]
MFLTIVAGLVLGLLALLLALVVAWAIAPRAVTRGIFRLTLLLFRVEVKGAEHLDSQGPAVYVSNHVSLFDGPLVLALVRRRLNVVVYTTWAKGLMLRAFGRAFDISPIDPQRPMSAKAMARRVSEGEACLIFPEGRITTTGAPMKIAGGAAWMVDTARADVIAIHIEGLERSKLAKAGNGWRKVWFPKVRVCVAPPQRLEIDPDLRGKLRRERATMALREITETLRYQALDRHNNIPEAVAEARAVHGSKAIAYEDVLGTTMSRGKLRLTSAMLVAMIGPHVKKDSNLGFLLPTAPGAVAVLNALWQLRVTPAILNHTVGVAAVKTTLGVVKADMILSSRTFVEKGRLTDFVAGLEAEGVRFLWLEDLKAGLTTGAKLGALFSLNRLPKDVTRDTPAAILFTSGTEGAPKGVVLSHGNILANISQIRARANVGPQDISCTALPVFHSFGLTAGLILPLVCGIRTGVHPSPLHYRIIPELAYSVQATLLFGTDTFLNGWARRADPSDFATLRAVVAGAEAVKESTRKIWAERFGVRVLEGYGATECSPVLSLNTPAEPDIGTVGRLLPAMEYRLVEMAGIDGSRLMVKGPNVMAGYILNDKPGVLQPPPEGWYDTGDAVTIDEKGLIRITGRIKRFAKVGGEMVSLQSVEILAQKLWPGATVAAISRPHPRTGEQVILCVTEPAADRPKLVQYARDNGVGSILLPAQVLVREKIPLLASGKIDYPALTRSFEEAEAAKPG